MPEDTKEHTEVCGPACTPVRHALCHGDGARNGIGIRRGDGERKGDQGGERKRQGRDGGVIREGVRREREVTGREREGEGERKGNDEGE